MKNLLNELCIKNFNTLSIQHVTRKKSNLSPYLTFSLNGDSSYNSYLMYKDDEKLTEYIKSVSNLEIHPQIPDMFLWKDDYFRKLIDYCEINKYQVETFYYDVLDEDHIYFNINCNTKDVLEKMNELFEHLK